MTKTPEDYKKRAVEEVLTDLGTDKEALSEDEVLKRLSQYSYNDNISWNEASGLEISQTRF